jgi:membrane carboxypeptidase/penicillin-binding protein
VRLRAVRIARETHLPAAQGSARAQSEDGILAEVGGFSYSRSKFNRAVQSNRQPGSSFKPYFMQQRSNTVSRRPR